MSSIQKLHGINGKITIEIEGFFTERVINLCKTNNIEVWNMRQVTDGFIKVDIPIKEISRIKAICRKTKCRFKIIDKKGFYFIKRRYRKRKVYILLFVFVLISYYISSKFVWEVSVKGNNHIASSYIIQKSYDIGLKPGKCKIFLDTNVVAKELRASLPEVAWLSINKSGTNIEIEVVEKIKAMEKIDKDTPCNISASKSGYITKITASEGTKLFEVGEYISKGMTAITGIIEGAHMTPIYVHSQGELLARIIYRQSYEVKYEYEDKEYSDSKTAIGLVFGDNRYIIRGNKKDAKYEDNVTDYAIKIFGARVGVVWGKYTPYQLVKKTRTKEECIQHAKAQFEEYLKVNAATEQKILDNFDKITGNEDGIIVECRKDIEENIMEYQELLKE